MLRLRPRSELPPSIVFTFPDSVDWIRAEPESTRKAPLFVAADHVRGHLLVKASTSLNWLYPSDTIRIDLLGWVSGCRMNSSNIDNTGVPVEQKWRKQVLHLKFSRPSNIELGPSTAKRSHAFPFCFRLHGDPTSHGSHESSGITKSEVMPSSLHVRSTSITGKGSFVINASAEVNYLLRAWVIRNQVAIAMTKHPVHIFDSVSEDPPQYVPKLGAEHPLACRVNLKKNMVATLARISATPHQPVVFHFHKAQGSATAHLQLTFALEKLRAPFDASALSPLVAEVKWRICIHTFISTKAMGSIPSVQESETSKSLTHISSLSEEKDFKIRLADWHSRDNPENSKNQDYWETTQAVLLNLSRIPLLAPNFFNPYLTRTYSIDMNIRIRGVAKASIRLLIPCQLVYEKEADSIEGMRMLENGHDEMTRSVRGDIEHGRRLGSTDSELPFYVP